MAEEKTFCGLIRETRDALGLRQYKVAEMIRMPIQRLKNLETGYFRVMPQDDEINRLSAFYELPESILKKKAEEHVRSRKNQLKFEDRYG